MKPWKQLSTEVKFKNPWWEYRLDRFELPDGKEGEYHYVHTKGSVLVVPITSEGSIVVTRQYRYLMRRESFEFLTGAVEEGESYEQAALRECSEEVGLLPGRLELVGSFAPSNGKADAMMYVYLAQNLAEVDGEPDETEDIQRLSVNVAGVDAAIASGGMWDGTSIAGWHLIRPRLVE